MMVEILRTTVINPHLYVDLTRVNNEVKTFVLEKAANPNVFQTKEQHDGDVFDKVVKRLSAPAAETD
jgi:hypothetical protein